MNKRKVIIGLSIVITLTITMALGFGGIKIVNANKINSSIELGIKYLTEGNYEEAILEFSKAISIDSKNDKANELLGLVEGYKELETLYAGKDYLLASELINKLKENQYLSYIEGKVEEIAVNNEAKVVIIKEIEGIDALIDQLISENKYQEALDLINKYLAEDLKEEYLNKLNELNSKIEESKVDYEKEIARQEEEKKKQEELARQEEERKRQEEQQANRIISNKDEAIARLIEVRGLSENESAWKHDNIITGNGEYIGYYIEITHDYGDRAMFSYYLVKQTGEVYKHDIVYDTYTLISN